MACRSLSESVQCYSTAVWIAVCGVEWCAIVCVNFCVQHVLVCAHVWCSRAGYVCVLVRVRVHVLVCKCECVCARVCFAGTVSLSIGEVCVAHYRMCNGLNAVTL